MVALADASALAAERARTSGEAATEAAGPAEGLRRHAEEEAAHVALWEQFEHAAASAPGAAADSSQSQSADAGAADAELEQTRACVRAWTAGESLLEHLAVLYDKMNRTSK